MEGEIRVSRFFFVQFAIFGVSPFYLPSLRLDGCLMVKIGLATKLLGIADYFQGSRWVLLIKLARLTKLQLPSKQKILKFSI